MLFRFQIILLMLCLGFISQTHATTFQFWSSPHDSLGAAAALAIAAYFRRNILLANARGNVDNFVSSFNTQVNVAGGVLSFYWQGFDDVSSYTFDDVISAVRLIVTNLSGQNGGSCGLHGWGTIDTQTNCPIAGLSYEFVPAGGNQKNSVRPRSPGTPKNTSDIANLNRIYKATKFVNTTHGMIPSGTSFQFPMPTRAPNQTHTSPYKLAIQDSAICKRSGLTISMPKCTGRDTLLVGQRLYMGDSLWSNDGFYRLFVQSDGGLCLWYYQPSMTMYWCLPRVTTEIQAPSDAYWTLDNNAGFHIVGSNLNYYPPGFKTGQNDGMFRLTIQNDGNLVLYRGVFDSVLFSSGTNLRAYKGTACNAQLPPGI